ncbi:hypothetical protein HK405_004338 [Cladochytrium tenue]|nr:hypothetical protein HK405_004338 [Cladochytrium tenue]
MPPRQGASTGGPVDTPDIPPREASYPTSPAFLPLSTSAPALIAAPALVAVGEPTQGLVLLNARPTRQTQSLDLDTLLSAQLSAAGHSLRDQLAPPAAPQPLPPSSQLDYVRPSAPPPPPPPAPSSDVSWRSAPDLRASRATSRAADPIKSCPELQSGQPPATVPVVAVVEGPGGSTLGASAKRGVDSLAGCDGDWVSDAGPPDAEDNGSAGDLVRFSDSLHKWSALMQQAVLADHADLLAALQRRRDRAADAAARRAADHVASLSLQLRDATAFADALRRRADAAPAAIAAAGRFAAKMSEAEKAMSDMALAYEERLKEARLDSAEARLLRSEEARARAHQDMKRALMRGVCALNLETMAVLKSATSEDTSEGKAATFDLDSLVPILSAGTENDRGAAVAAATDLATDTETITRQTREMSALANSAQNAAHMDVGTAASASLVGLSTTTDATAARSILQTWQHARPPTHRATEQNQPSFAFQLVPSAKPPAHNSQPPLSVRNTSQSQKQHQQQQQHQQYQQHQHQQQLQQQHHQLLRPPKNAHMASTAANASNAAAATGIAAAAPAGVRPRAVRSSPLDHRSAV